MTNQWIPKTPEEAYRRAGGRRRYHDQRRQHRDQRQLVIMALLVKLSWPGYGIGRLLAKAFSVDPATISRDIKYLRGFRAKVIGITKYKRAICRRHNSKHGNSGNPPKVRTCMEVQL